MKLTKQQLKNHDECLRRLEADELSLDDKDFILDNWQPGAHSKTRHSAFYTPQSLAAMVALVAECDNPSDDRPLVVLDLAAGIGSLAYAYQQHVAYKRQPLELVCVELDPDSIAVGKKILPEARWLQLDLTLESVVKSLPRGDVFVSNPPFGLLPKQAGTRVRASALWEYYIAEIGLAACGGGAMIVPQGSLPFRESGRSFYEARANDRYEKWSQDRGIRLAPTSLDTAQAEGFLATNVPVEVVWVEPREE